MIILYVNNVIKVVKIVYLNMIIVYNVMMIWYYMVISVLKNVQMDIWKLIKYAKFVIQIVLHVIKMDVYLVNLL